MGGTPDSRSQIYYPIDIESWIVADHPLRAVKRRADEAWSATTFTKNRERFEKRGLLRKLFERVSEGSDDDDAGHPTVNFRGETARGSMKPSRPSVRPTPVTRHIV